MNFTTVLFCLGRRKDEPEVVPDLEKCLNEMLDRGFIPLCVISDMSHEIVQEQVQIIPPDTEPLYFVLVLQYFKTFEA